MKGTFLFLGTGGSVGIPVIGCHCEVCSSSFQENQRLRPSALVTMGEKRFLIDIGPDFRTQALRHRIDRFDGLLLTHTHYDHIAGIDELRLFYVRHKKAVPCLLSEESLHELQVRYRYLFQPIGEAVSLPAQLELHLLPDEIGEKEFCGMNIGYCSYFQGGMKVTGYRFGDFAYITDIREYDESVFVALKGVHTLVLSTLRKEGSRMHLTLDEAVAFARKTKAQKVLFTHISHALEFHQTNRELPLGMALAYDGLEVEFEF